MSPKVRIRLCERQPLSSRTWLLRYERSDQQPITYVPGQFFSLHFPAEQGNQTRSYSIATRSEDVRLNRSLEFAITEVKGGAASRYFPQAELGSEIEMSGPFGALILPPLEQPKRLLLVATGTGVAPYRSMLPELHRRLLQQPTLQIELLLGVREPSELLWGEEFIAFAKRHPGFNFTACYSRQMPTEPLPFERAGRVIAQLDSLAPQADEATLVYLCGHPEMIDEGWALLQQRGFGVRQVKREKYLLSGH